MSVVYLVECGPGGPIKIGFTDDAYRRLSKAQSDSPYELRLLATMPGGPELEAELHARFGEYRIRGEWFWPAQELRSFVDSFGAPKPRVRQLEIRPVPAGNPMRQMRLRMGMTQKELARHLNMQQPHVCRMERAEILHPRALLAMEALASRFAAESARATAA